jgi:hypothetical protein
MLSIVNHKLEGVLLHVSSISRRLRVQSNGAAQITRYHLVQRLASVSPLDENPTYNIILLDRVPVTQCKSAEDGLPFPISVIMVNSPIAGVDHHDELGSLTT